MINHIVFLQFKKNLSKSVIDNVFNQLGELKAHIPAIQNFSFGNNCSPEKLNQGFTHVFVMQFETKADRDFYLEHPEHKKIAQSLIIPNLENGLESLLVMDYDSV